jgi:hypothetical protein
MIKAGKLGANKTRYIILSCPEAQELYFSKIRLDCYTSCGKRTTAAISR